MKGRTHGNGRLNRVRSPRLPRPDEEVDGLRLIKKGLNGVELTAALREDPLEERTQTWR